MARLSLVRETWLLKVCLVIRLLAVVVDLSSAFADFLLQLSFPYHFEVLDLLCLLYLFATALPTENVRIKVITCSRQFVPLQNRHTAE